eukprot:Transcript_21947.p3 GENE.Transcript_21947~~Transcript_21947.p3  ORF type:complete len:105 (+),score=11.90 Transcript_21947:127-441(+)
MIDHPQSAAALNLASSTSGICTLPTDEAEHVRGSALVHENQKLPVALCSGITYAVALPTLAVATSSGMYPTGPSSPRQSRQEFQHGEAREPSRQSQKRLSACEK